MSDYIQLIVIVGTGLVYGLTRIHRPKTLRPICTVIGHIRAKGIHTHTFDLGRALEIHRICKRCGYHSVSVMSDQLEDEALL